MKKGDSVMCVKHKEFGNFIIRGFIFNELKIYKSVDFTKVYSVGEELNGNLHKRKKDRFVYLNGSYYNFYECRLVLFEKTIR